MSRMKTALVVGAYIFLIWLSLHFHWELPSPKQDLFAQNGPQFSEAKAREYIRDLSLHDDGLPKYRIVGTKDLVEAESYVLQKADEIKKMSQELLPGSFEIEVWHQRGASSHLFDFMGKDVWKTYNLTNVVVRLSDGTEEAKNNAVLVNAHLDSTLPSPGAADDLFGVGIMLEALRVLALTPKKMPNSIVFLFNGGEESLQDASHLFITEHPIRHTIRTVLNLEAAGTGGKSIIFQATSEDAIHAISKMPRPWCTVMALDVFSTGLILSDTDFRQFIQYGNLTGIDLALVKNSYFYHTRSDVEAIIEPGSIQLAGENVLALLEHFTMSDFRFEGNALPVERGIIFFSILGGHFYFVMSGSTVVKLFTALTTLIAIYIAGDLRSFARLKVYAWTLLGTGLSLAVAFLTSSATAFLIKYVLGKSMVWFSWEWSPVFMYAPAILASIIAVQSIFADIGRDLLQVSRGELEHSSLTSLLCVFTLLYLTMYNFRLGSSYLPAVSALSLLVSLVYNDYIVPLIFGKGTRFLAYSTYVVMQALPFLLGVEGLAGLLEIFVPLTGRLGYEAPVDLIIGILLAIMAVPILPVLHPLTYRLPTRAGGILVLVFMGAFFTSLGYFSLSGMTGFDAAHPRRVLFFHMENLTTTPPTYDLHAAFLDSLDSTALIDMALNATASPLAYTGAAAAMQPLPADDEIPDFDIIYPVNQFIHTYRLPLPAASIEEYASPFHDSFKISVVNSTLDIVRGRRALHLVLNHPGLIWAVMAFDANVVSWDLTEPPREGLQRYHVKSVNTYDTSHVSLKLDIALDQDQIDALLRIQQRNKGHRRIDGMEDDVKVGLLKVDYSALDLNGMWPACIHYSDAANWNPGMRFFSEFDKAIPDHVDAMHVSSVFNSVYV